ncbi:calmodulin-dependent protein kinase CMK2 [Sugiyamaella lignohabitans]|uniref:calcium/calmodulin-dependent protein kinase n=1 Tax=Sugiyamaella lignohabitans TaxID=796027 RepID=A0A167CX64_9ASCO|nr:calmodulin-dependent protein kinase CMK2 [Sugiyamaella lignohabitans]ANB12214.1 calmodulin-dependent protein kinase CMK2 [Sugiyamaella lignohabitans]
MSSIQSFLGKVTGQPSSYSKKHNYTFGKVLGAGTFGVVRVARISGSKDEVAVKIILKKALKGNEEMVLEEIKMLQKLHHAHIVEFKDWFESRDKFYIVTQLATGGELFDRIIDRGRFTEEDASKCIRDIVDAVAYIHGQDIVHRDLKPENLLYVTKEKDSDLVLADFGIAKLVTSPDEKLTTMAGSFGYAAPEIFLGTGHGKPCDIWSLGVISYTVLSGYSPFRAETVDEFLEEVDENYQVVFHTRYWKHVSTAAKELISRMMQVNPDKRPTADELLRDPWITGEAAEDTHDLLPTIRTGFNARTKFRLAIEAVKLANRIKALEMGDEGKEEEADPDSREGPLQYFHHSATTGSTSSSSSSTTQTSTHPGTSTKNAGAKLHEIVLAAQRAKEIQQQDQQPASSTGENKPV